MIRKILKKLLLKLLNEKSIAIVDTKDIIIYSGQFAEISRPDVEFVDKFQNEKTEIRNSMHVEQEIFNKIISDKNIKWVEGDICGVKTWKASLYVIKPKI